MTATLEKFFPLRYHEIDPKGLIKPLALLHYIQDSASTHAEQLGVSVKKLHEIGLGWVLSRLHIIIEQNQHPGDSVRVLTWPSSRQGRLTCREFEIFYDYDAEHIAARATTSWAAVKLDTRRPVKLDEYLPDYPMHEHRAIDDNFELLPGLTTSQPDQEMHFRVQRSDLDINNHVNNVVYAGWALETVPDEIAKGLLTELEISYRAESVYGETIISRCTVDESGPSACCLHQIVNSSNGRELVRLRSRWQHF